MTDLIFKNVCFSLHMGLLDYIHSIKPFVHNELIRLSWKKVNPPNVQGFPLNQLN